MRNTLVLALLLAACTSDADLGADSPCPAPRLSCPEERGRRCVDPRSENRHCGACNNACGAQSACVGGMCCAGPSLNNRCLGTAFGAPQEVPSGGEDTRILLADMDGDGFDDLVTSSQANEFVRIFWGNREGRLDPMAFSRVNHGRTYIGIDVGDLDEDGRLDIVMARESPRHEEHPDRITVLRAQPGERGRFERTLDEPEPMEPNSLTLGDFDGDHHLDLIAQRQLDGCLWLRRGDGRGNLAPGRCVVTWPEIGEGRRGVRLVPMDVDGDGRDELAVAAPSGLRLLRLDADGGMATFTEPFPRAFSQLADSEWTDIDGDGHREILWKYGVPPRGFPQMSVVAPQNGTLSLPGIVFSLGTREAFSSMGDFNGDGLPDGVGSRGSPDGDKVFLVLRR